MRNYCLAALFLIGIAGSSTSFGFGHIEDRDFASLWLAGRGVLSGVDIYDTDVLRAFGHQLLKLGPPYNATYPPHALFLFVPFSLLPLTAAFVTWGLFSAALFYWAAKPLMPSGFPAILSTLTPAALINLNFGQTGLVAAALFLFAFRGSGIAAAMLTFKPQMGLLVLPSLLSDRKALVTAILATAVLLLCSAFLFANWEEFLIHVQEFQGRRLVDGSESVWVLLGVTPMIGYGLWGWLLFAIGATYFLARNFNVFTAATATFLISPYGFHYDMAAACLGFAILLFSYWDLMPMWHKATASLAFLAPVIVGFGTWLVPPILLVGLMVQSEWMEGHRLRRIGHSLRAEKVGRRPEGLPATQSAAE